MHVRSLAIIFCVAIRISVEDYFFPFDDATFETDYSWSYINFTWESSEQYSDAVNRRNYIPENIMIAGPRIYKNNLYLTLPKFRTGVPATLTSMPFDTPYRENHLLSPFPNWEANNVEFCWNLQSVLGTEIDTSGIMWVLDGHRLNDNRCPPKLVLLDLNNNGRLVHTFIFPNDICLQDGGFLNDVVIDEADDTYAYITDNSNIDPGLIVYTRRQNRAWKLRDGSMFPELRASNYMINNVLVDTLGTIDGIALAPYTKDGKRTLYYTALTGYSVYAIRTEVLKNEAFTRGDQWRRHVKYVGDKQSQTDGMIMDNKGDLYYGLLNLYGVGKWNILEPFEFSEIIHTNTKTIVWPDGFTMDQNGFLYLISNSAFLYFDTNKTLNLTPDISFRIHKTYTGTKSYLYSFDCH